MEPIRNLSTDPGGFRDRFEAIRAGMGALTEWQRERDRREAGGFNIFRVLGIDTREVKTHSAMLGCLLDPEGAHGQGDLFLSGFLKRGSAKGGFLPTAFADLPTGGWQSHCEVRVEASRPSISEEESAGTDSGRVDIVLRHAPSRSLIVIENKIYAADQPQQLERYFRWMERRRRVWHRQALLYLAPDRKQPSGRNPLEFGCVMPSDGCDGRTSFSCLTWRGDVVGLLEECLPRVQSPFISIVLSQYLETLTRL